MPTKSQPVTHPPNDRLELVNALRDYLLVAREDLQGLEFLCHAEIALEMGKGGRPIVVSGDSFFSKLVFALFEARQVTYRYVPTVDEPVQPNEFHFHIPFPNRRREDFPLVTSFMFNRIRARIEQAGGNPPTLVDGGTLRYILGSLTWTDFSKLDRFIDVAMSMEWYDGRIKLNNIGYSIRHLFDSDVDRDESSVHALFTANSHLAASYLRMSDGKHEPRPIYFSVNSVGQVLKNAIKLGNENFHIDIGETPKEIRALRRQILQVRNAILNDQESVDWDQQVEMQNLKAAGICNPAQYSGLMIDTNLGLVFDHEDDTCVKWAQAAEQLGVDAGAIWPVVHPMATSTTSIQAGLEPAKEPPEAAQVSAGPECPFSDDYRTLRHKRRNGSIEDILNTARQAAIIRVLDDAKKKSGVGARRDDIPNLVCAAYGEDRASDLRLTPGQLSDPGWLYDAFRRNETLRKYLDFQGSGFVRLLYEPQPPKSKAKPAKHSRGRTTLAQQKSTRRTS